MNDKDILLRLLQQAYTDDSLSQVAKQEFEKLVTRFDEDNAELEISIRDLTDVREKILRSLSDKGYTAQSLRYHGPNDGHVLHVNLRGKRFLEVADNQSKGEESMEAKMPPSPFPNAQQKPMQDSGQRQTFESGAVRDTAEGKPRPDLFSPFAMERIGFWLEAGARKYSEHNWSKGIPASRCMASLHRHLMKYMQGATDEDHLSAVATNCMFLLHFEEAVKRGFLPESLLDMPKYNAIPRVHQNQDEILDHEPDEEFRWRAIHEQSQR